MNEQSQTGTILFEVALLTIVVLLVDETLMRGALAFIPALLLAQRALQGSVEASEDWTSTDDRRSDQTIRKHVNKLLDHFREFYTTCHLMGSGGITSEEALQRTNDLEMELNRLLDEVTHESEELADLPVLEATL